MCCLRLFGYLSGSATMDAAPDEKVLLDEDNMPQNDDHLQAIVIREMRRSTIRTILFLLDKHSAEQEKETHDFKDNSQAFLGGGDARSRSQQFVRIAKSLELRVWREANHDLDAYPTTETKLKTQLREIVRRLKQEHVQTSENGN